MRGGRTRKKKEEEKNLSMVGIDLVSSKGKRKFDAFDEVGEITARRRGNREEKKRKERREWRGREIR